MEAILDALGFGHLRERQFQPARALGFGPNTDQAGFFFQYVIIQRFAPEPRHQHRVRAVDGDFAQYTCHSLTLLKDC